PLPVGAAREEGALVPLRVDPVPPAPVELVGRVLQAERAHEGGAEADVAQPRLPVDVDPEAHMVERDPGAAVRAADAGGEAAHLEPQRAEELREEAVQLVAEAA